MLKITILGRPNVGKSTLMNRLLGRRRAIVHGQPGSTRDRSDSRFVWEGHALQITDTGGWVPPADLQHPDTDRFAEATNRQVEHAMAQADVLLMVVDGETGPVPWDETVAQLVRQSGKPVVLAANKLDKKDQRLLASDFYALGLGEPYAISAKNGGGVAELLEHLMQLGGLCPAPADDEVEDTSPQPPQATGADENDASPFPEAVADETTEETPDSEMQDDLPDDAPLRLTLLGRPNVGKSSLFNAIAGEPRTIVSEIPGTTRDAIDIEITHQDRPYILVDTAGIRRRGKIDFGVEWFSVERSLQSLKQADVAVVVIDATEGLTDQDKRLINTVWEEGRGLVMVVNQWDRIPDKGPNSAAQYQKKLSRLLPLLQDVPFVFTSAVTGQRVFKVLELARDVAQNHRRRVRTSVANQVLQEALSLTPPPPYKNKRLKVLYVTQVAAAPPTFVLFVNDAQLLKASYQRYLERKLREAFAFTGTPVRLLARNRAQEKR